jgi:hypothetical protein
MEILLIFDEKQRSPNKEQVIKLIEREEFILDKGRYKVLFPEINFAFQKILSICGSWATTELYIDNMKLNPSDIIFITSCHKKNRCNGICLLISQRGTCNYEELFFWIGQLCDPSFQSQNYNTKYIEKFDGSIIGLDFIKKIGDSIYELDKEKLKNRILKESELPLKVCPSISEEKIFHQINSLPEKIQIKIRQDSRALPRNETTDPPKYVGLTNNQKERYKEVAELIAPIFAREIAKELTKLFEENNKTIETEQK